MRSGILHPEYLTISGPDGAVYRGAGQEWYPNLWQRRAGCGPTAAALLAAYLAATRPALRALYPDGDMGREAFTGLMCRVWEHVTPGSHGLNRPEKFAAGFSCFAASVGLDLTPRVMELPAARTKRPPYEAFAAFIGAGLGHDCPVAFLNLHNGRVGNLDRWHWVTLIALEGERAVMLDSGNEVSIDLALWHETSKKRGAFVTFPEGAGG